MIARIDLAGLRAERGDITGARELYEAAAAASGIPRFVTQAQALLGNLLADQGDQAGAEAAYQAAIDAGDPYWAQVAQVLLARLAAARPGGPEQAP